MRRFSLRGFNPCAVACRRLDKSRPYRAEKRCGIVCQRQNSSRCGQRGRLERHDMSWGSIGELWGKPIVTVVVDHSRYTYSLMGLYDYFTITAFPKKMNEALDYIGSHSKKTDKNKIQNAGLTTMFTELGNPTFKEGNLIIECRTIYEAPIDVDNMLDDDIIKMYQDNKLKHTMFVGEIVNVWKR